MNQRLRLYQDTTNKVFVVGNFRAIGSGRGILRALEGNTVVGVSVPGMGDPLKPVLITDIEKSANGGTYASLSEILLSCRGLFQAGADLDAAALCITFTTTAASTAITLPVTGTDTVSVDWGDGNTSNYDLSSTTPSNTYADAGTYTAKLTGTSLSTINFNGAAAADYVDEITIHGDFGFTTLTSAFQGLPNATDITLTNMIWPSDCSYMFYNSSEASINTGNVDTSAVTNMSYTFQDCTKFNHYIGHWDVSNVTDMAYMFSNAKRFNQPLDTWDVSNVTNMNYLFNNCYAFEQDVSKWDVSNVTSMAYMFRYCINFDHDLSSWEIQNVTNFTNFMIGVTLSTANCTALLKSWAYKFNASVTAINFGNSTYDSSDADCVTALDYIENTLGITVTGLTPA